MKEIQIQKSERERAPGAIRASALDFLSAFVIWISGFDHLPASLATVMSPSITWQNLRSMARRRPVPPYFLLVELIRLPVREHERSELALICILRRHERIRTDSGRKETTERPE